MTKRGKRVAFFTKLWLPVFIWAALLFGLSSIPSDLTPSLKLLIPLDKIVHIVLYFIFGMLIARGLANSFSQLLVVHTSVIAIVSATGFGIFDEFHQNLIGREADIYDVAADFIGAAFSQYFYFSSKAQKLLTKYRKKSSKDKQR